MHSTYYRCTQGTHFLREIQRLNLNPQLNSYRTGTRQRWRTAMMCTQQTSGGRIWCMRPRGEKLVEPQENSAAVHLQTSGIMRDDPASVSSSQPGTSPGNNEKKEACQTTTKPTPPSRQRQTDDGDEIINHSLYSSPPEGSLPPPLQAVREPLLEPAKASNILHSKAPR